MHGQGETPPRRLSTASLRHVLPRKLWEGGSQRPTYQSVFTGVTPWSLRRSPTQDWGVLLRNRQSSGLHRVF